VPQGDRGHRYLQIQQLEVEVVASNPKKKEEC
jgi:hypothetical protein